MNITKEKLANALQLCIFSFGGAIMTMIIFGVIVLQIPTEYYWYSAPFIICGMVFFVYKIMTFIQNNRSPTVQDKENNQI